MSGFVGRPVTCAERDKAILEMYLSDRLITPQEIADKFGLTRANVNSIIHRQKKARGLLKEKKSKK